MTARDRWLLGCRNGIRAKDVRQTCNGGSVGTEGAEGIPEGAFILSTDPYSDEKQVR